MESLKQQLTQEGKEILEVIEEIKEIAIGYEKIG